MNMQLGRRQCDVKQTDKGVRQWERKKKYPKKTVGAQTNQTPLMSLRTLTFIQRK